MYADYAVTDGATEVPCAAVITASASERRSSAFTFVSFTLTETPTRSSAAPDAWTGESQRLSLYIISWNHSPEAVKLTSTSSLSSLTLSFITAASPSSWNTMGSNSFIGVPKFPRRV